MDIFNGETGQLIFNILSELSIVTAICGTLAFVSYILLNRLSHQKDAYDWAKILGKTWKGPVPFLIIIYGLLIGIELALDENKMELATKGLHTLRSLFSVLALVWLTFRWKSGLETSYFVTKDQKSLLLAISRLSSILIIAIAVLMSLKVLEIPVETLVALGGIATLTVGWAGKDVVANLFGGLMIYINRPFSVADYIHSPNKNFKGVVEEIGWYMTLIRDPDRLPTYIPNALITDAVVYNYTRMKNRRMKIAIGLRYDDFKKVKTIIDETTKMLINHPGIESSITPTVHFIQYGNSSLDLELLACTKTNQFIPFRDIKQQILFEIANIIEKQGAEMAYPTSTVYLQEPAS